MLVVALAALKFFDDYLYSTFFWTNPENDSSIISLNGLNLPICVPNRWIVKTPSPRVACHLSLSHPHVRPTHDLMDLMGHRVAERASTEARCAGASIPTRG